MEDLCAWVVVLLLLSSFLHSLFAFRENLVGGKLEEAVAVTERTLRRLCREPGLLENLKGTEERVGVWRGENLLEGREKPGGKGSVVLPAALKKGFSALLVGVEAWE